MGWTIRHVQCSCPFVPYFTHLSVDRITLRPSAQDKDIFQFALAGPGVNGIEPSATGEDLVKTFYSITGRTDIVFGDFVWLSKFRSEQDMIFFYVS